LNKVIATNAGLSSAGAQRKTVVYLGERVVLTAKIPNAASVLRNREFSDAAVILSIGVLAAAATVHMDGFGWFSDLVRANASLHLDAAATAVLFLAMATAVYGIRRIADQRRERTRRVMAERRARALALYDPLTRLPNRVQLEQHLMAA
jgi:predicted signal transduction protein with EAL and GGDEF domain